MIVTLDGPAGSGKSTLARSLATRLGFERLDTGAMYRAVGWAVAERNIDPTDHAAVAELAGSLPLSQRNGELHLDGEPLGERIRTEAVSAAASRVAVIPEVRAAMVTLQRAAARGTDLVSEGRDQGTVVFPEAERKFFVTASVEQRAERRRNDLLRAGESIPLDQLIEQIRERDHRDAHRETAPLKPAADAVLIDTTDRTIDELLEELETAVRSHTAFSASRADREG